MKLSKWKTEIPWNCPNHNRTKSTQSYVLVLGAKSLRNKNTTADCEFIVLRNRRADIIQSANNTSNEIENSTRKIYQFKHDISIKTNKFYLRKLHYPFYFSTDYCIFTGPYFFYLKHTVDQDTLVVMVTRARDHDWWLITYPHLQQKSLLWWRNSLSIRITSILLACELELLVIKWKRYSLFKGHWSISAMVIGS